IYFPFTHNISILLDNESGCGRTLADIEQVRGTPGKAFRHSCRVMKEMSVRDLAHLLQYFSINGLLGSRRLYRDSRQLPRNDSHISRPRSTARAQYSQKPVKVS